MTTDTYLFIGGPKDGERIEVQPLRERVEVVARPPVGLYGETSRNEFATTGVENHSYRASLWCGGSDRQTIFVHSSLKSEDVMIRLIEGYQAKPHPTAQALAEAIEGAAGAVDAAYGNGDVKPAGAALIRSVLLAAFRSVDDWRCAGSPEKAC